MDKEENKLTTGQRVAEVIRTILTIILSVSIVVAALLFASSNGPQKSLFGFRYYIVLTPSMTPSYKVGDIVVVKLCNADAVEVGDAITFNPSHDGNTYLTHRVVEKFLVPNGDGTDTVCFRTKGDNNAEPDGFAIEEERLIGKVKFSVPKLGYVIRFVRLKWYFVIPILIAFFVMLYTLRLYIDSGREDDEGEESKSSEEKGKKEDEGSKIAEEDKKNEEVEAAEEEKKDE